MYKSINTEISKFISFWLCKVGYFYPDFQSVSTRRLRTSTRPYASVGFSAMTLRNFTSQDLLFFCAALREFVVSANLRNTPQYYLIILLGKYGCLRNHPQNFRKNCAEKCETPGSRNFLNGLVHNLANVLVDGGVGGGHFVEVVFSNLGSKPRDPNPDNNSLIRKRCCKRRMESLICRCFLSYNY